MYKLFKLILPFLLAFPLWAQGPGGGGAQNITAQRALTRTVATLPAAGSAGRIYIVTDGTDKADCTVGSGSERVLCIDTGSAWTSASSAGTASLAGSADNEVLWNDAGSINGIALTEDQTICGNASSEPVACDPGITSRTDSDGTVALLSTDRGRRVIATHATSSAVSIAQAGGAGFAAGYATRLLCAIGAGTCTLTPTTSTVNGNTTLTLNQGEEAIIVSDGTNYSASVDSNFFTLTYLHYGAAAALADTDDVPDIWIAKFPITITQICGRADTGTSTFNIQKDDGSAASISTANIVADTTEACSSTFTAGENVVATGNALDFLQVTGATSGAPTRITVTISYVRR